MRALLLAIFTLAASGPAGLAQVSRQKAARPLTSVELLLKLYHGTPAAAAAAIKVRGTGFDMTPTLERLLVEAGADKSLLALAALRRTEQAPRPPAGAVSSSAAAAIRMDAAAQARKLIQRQEAAHPAAARQSGGKVRLDVQVGMDGRVKNARLISGEEPFAAAALEAARGYVYRPTVLDGEAVEVISEVVIEFQPASGDKD